MKRKILAMTLAVTMVIGLTSCGERDRSSRRHSDDATGSSVSAISAEETEEAVEETATEEEVADQEEKSEEVIGEYVKPKNVKKVKLKKIGEIADPDQKMDFDDYAPILNDGNKKTVCNYLGKKLDIDITNGELRYGISADDSIDGKGAFEIRTSGEVNTAGLYSEDGTELIACKADYISQMEEDSRFVKVIYVTKKTDHADDAIMYYTDSIVGSITPGPDDDMYEGYARFYDLKSKKMVPLPDITTSEELNKYTACGDSLIYNNSYNNEIIVYSASGKMIRKYTNNDMGITIGKTIYCINKGGKTYSVCDDSAKELFNKNKTMKCAKEYQDYIQVINGEKCSVYNQNGKEIISGDYTEFCDMCGDEVFGMRKGDWRIYVAKDGTVLYKSEKYKDAMSKGVWSSQKKNGKYDVLDERGQIAVTNEQPELAFYKDNEDKKNCFIYNKKKYVKLPEARYSDFGVLLKTQNEKDGLFSLYELVDGKRLLKKYNEIKKIDNYIYAYKDGNWSVYKASIPEKYKEQN